MATYSTSIFISTVAVVDNLLLASNQYCIANYTSASTDQIVQFYYSPGQTVATNIVVGSGPTTYILFGGVVFQNG